MSGAIATQATDVEEECDGLVNYDRTSKFSSGEAAQVAACNARLVAAAGG